MDQLIDNFIASADGLAQVLAAIYIAIAIFSGEQVATSFKGSQPHIRVNPRRYVEYLNLRSACACLVLLPIIGSLYEGGTYDARLRYLAAALVAGLVAVLLYTIYNTLVHREIERKFKSITGSVSRLVAWTLSREKDRRERLKLLGVLFERAGNDIDLEHYMLETLHGILHDAILHPAKDQTEALQALMTLRHTITKRPLHDKAYTAHLRRVLEACASPASRSQRRASAAPSSELPAIAAAILKAVS